MLKKITFSFKRNNSKEGKICFCTCLLTVRKHSSAFLETVVPLANAKKRWDFICRYANIFFYLQFSSVHSFHSIHEVNLASFQQRSSKKSEGKVNIYLGVFYASINWIPWNAIGGHCEFHQMETKITEFIIIFQFHG